MRGGIFAFTLSTILFICSQAPAATFSTARASDGSVILTMTGEIVEGDFDDFNDALDQAIEDGQRVSLMRLDSPGGNILESVKIAEAVRDKKIATSVLGRAKCASACFIVFAAGTQKFASYGAFIGVHGASDESGHETVESNAATITMARIVKKLGVPPVIIGKMVVTPPSQIVWLTPEDLVSMNATLTGDPQQAQAQTPSMSQISHIDMQQESKISLNAPAPDPAQPPPSWDRLLDRAIELSRQQHDGTPAVERTCQPERRECTKDVSFRAPDGVAMVMKLTQDYSGRTLHREVCTLNTSRDIRSCVDWDTGDKHRDLKDRNGGWRRVEVD